MKINLLSRPVSGWCGDSDLLKKIFLLAWLVVFCALAAGSYGLKFDSDLWLSPDHPLEKQLNYLAEEFEEGESLFLILPLKQNFFSAPDVFPAIDDFEKNLRRVPGVTKTLSPLSAKIVVKKDGELQIRSFTSALQTGVIKNYGQFEALFTASPYHGKLLSRDGKTVGIQTRLDTRNLAAKRDKTLELIEEEIAYSPFRDVLLAGDAALKWEINRTVRNELFVLLVIGAAVVAFFLCVFVRDRFQVAVLMACLAIAVVQSLAMVNFLGHALTPVSLSVPLMVAVIVIADGLHIFSIWNKKAGALRATIGKTWLPCLVTSLTSAVGFGAFSVSNLIPVSNFGTDSFAAIVLCYPLLVATVWGALWAFPRYALRTNLKPGDKITSFTLWFSSKFSERRKQTALVFVAFCLVMAFSLSFARTETNFLNVLFKKSSLISAAFHSADENLGGSSSVEILVDSQSAKFFHKFDNMNRVRHLVGDVNSSVFVNDSNSYLLPLEITHRPLAAESESFSYLPRNDNELAQELLFLEFSRGEREKDLVSPYLNFNSSAARIEARIPNLTSSELDSLIGFTESASSKIFPDARILISGIGTYIHRLSGYVISTQIKSFALAFAVIGALFVTVFGARLGMAGFVSNLFPVLLSTGMLAVLKVPFDFATILVAGVTLGLSVDDSIHFLYHYKRNEGGHQHSESRIKQTLSIVARPVVLTSLLFCVTLWVFCFSTFVVMVKFALFTIAGLAGAVLSTVLFLPCLVGIFTQGGKCRRPLIRPDISG